MKDLIIIMIFVSLIFSCSENSTESDTPTEPDTKYIGITETSEDGSLIGNIDPDDWYYNSSTIDEPHVSPAYPNPTMGIIALRFSVPKEDSVKIWVDDPIQGKTATLSNQRLIAGAYTITFDLFKWVGNLKTDERIVRVFFDFVNEKDIPVIHGDVKIIRYTTTVGKLIHK